MQLKDFLIFVVGGIFGVVAGAGAMLIFFPFIFPPPEVNETVQAMEAESLLTETAFREGVSGQDAGHWGRGGLKIYRATDGEVLLEFQSDFETGPGPNFWIYLNTAADIDNEKDFNADSGRVKITKLKSFTGSQVYRVAAADFAAAKSVTIWCESFGQYIASANIDN